MGIKIEIDTADVEIRKALAGVNLNRVAGMSGIPQTTLFRIANQPGYDPRFSTVKKMVKFLESMGSSPLPMRDD